jgi:hypothetical protein
MSRRSIPSRSFPPMSGDLGLACDLQLSADRGFFDYAVCSTAHSRHSRMRAAMIAGPMNRPMRPQTSTPPRMAQQHPEERQFGGAADQHRADKWSAVKVTIMLVANTTTAHPKDPWASSRMAATEKITGAANGTIAATAVSVPNRVGARHLGDGIDQAEQHAFA